MHTKNSYIIKPPLTPSFLSAQSPPTFKCSSLEEKQREKGSENMIKLRGKRFCRSNSKLNANGGGGGGGKGCGGGGGGGGGVGGEIKWELRPGGLLVQKRDNGNTVGEGMIALRVSTVTQWHDISIQPTSTFGELKMILSVVTGLEPREQRVVYRGKEREDEEFLHMVGVRDMDKVLVLEDPAIKERKLNALSISNNQVLTNPRRSISV